MNEETQTSPIIILSAPSPTHHDSRTSSFNESPPLTIASDIPTRRPSTLSDHVHSRKTSLLSTLSAASVAVLQTTQHTATSCLQWFEFFFRWSLVPYAFCITGIYDLFTTRRDHGHLVKEILEGQAAFFGNIFLLLLFGKCIINFVHKAITKRKDKAFLSFLGGAFALAVMSVLPSIKVSSSSVKVLEHPSLILTAIIMFAFSVFSTRWVGAVDLFYERIYKSIRYASFYQFLKDWKNFHHQVDDLKDFNFDPHRDDSIYDQMIEFFYIKIKEKDLKLSYSQIISQTLEKSFKFIFSIGSIILIPMWICLTAAGLKEIDPSLEKKVGLTFLFAFANPIFYFVSNFDVFTRVKDLLLMLHKDLTNKGYSPKWVSLGLSIALGFAIFEAIESGGGFASTMAGLIHDNFCDITNDVIPEVFLGIIKPYAVLLARLYAGGANLNGTVRFFQGCYDEKRAHPENSFLNCMLIFMELKKRHANVSTTTDFLPNSINLTEELTATDLVANIQKTIDEGNFNGSMLDMGDDIFLTSEKICEGRKLNQSSWWSRKRGGEYKQITVSTVGYGAI